MLGPDDVIEVMNLLRQAEVSAWLDGGWGVDALIGEQTRPHDDIDLVISIQDVARVVETLAPLGFKLNEDELPTRFGLRDPRDRRIDFHTVTFDGEGGGLQPLQDGRTYRYPPEGFGGLGMVAGITLPCLTAEVPGGVPSRL